MNRKLRRVVCACTALAVLASMSACANGGSESSAASSAESAADSNAVTTRQRETIETEPVVETLSGFDLSEITGEDTAVPEDFIFEAEAEDGELAEGASVMDKNFLGEFTGSGFAVLPSAETSVTFEIEFPAEGSYDIIMNSAADSEGMEASITIDGNALTTFKISSTKFSENSALKVLIGEGKHTIGIVPQKNPVYIDNLTIKPAEKIDPAQYVVSRELSNPNASEETKRLYNFLCDSYGKYIISGQYAADNNGVDAREFIEIEKNFGDYPAIMGLDLIEASPSRVAHGSDQGLKVVPTAKDWWLEQGGIVTICWHWNAPEPYIMKNGGAWWQGFYSEYVDIDLDKIMKGEDPEGYDLLVSDIDAIAVKLQELDDYHVPILWRPLHEGGGDPKWHNPWFWWGSSGSTAYKELWKLMYDRLTNYHNINNLIWVWNGQDPTYYPGDEYVDIVGYDVYADAGDYSSKKEYYDLTKNSAGTNKIVAMTENGTLFDPETAMNDGTRWAWFATWNGEFTIKDMQLPGEYTSMEMWEKIYTSDRVLTLKELPDLKNYPLDTEKYLSEHPEEAPAK
ncbi:MAG: glycosyl hydrolase [Oscillospiraceae bacterium]